MDLFFLITLWNVHDCDGTSGYDISRKVCFPRVLRKPNEERKHTRDEIFQQCWYICIIFCRRTFKLLPYSCVYCKETL